MNKQKQDTFKFYLITPLVLRGIKKNPELRVPSIKGILRWWLRVISPPDQCKQIEAEIFGSTEKVAKIRFFPISDILNTTKVNSKNPIWQHPLFYFNYPIAKDYAFQEGQNFNVKFSITGLNGNYLTYFMDAVTFLSFLGGLGSRSRRGYGSILISYTGKNDFIQSYFNKYLYFESIQNFSEKLKVIISKYRNGFSTQEYYHVSNLSVYIDFDRNGRNGYGSYEDALSNVIAIMQEVRGNKKKSGYNSDIKNLLTSFINKKSLSASSIKIESFGFGLPLNFQSRSLKQTAFQNFKLSNYKDVKSIGVIFNALNYERLASPLFVKIIEINDRYFPVISYFKNDLIENNIKITANFYARFKNKKLNLKQKMTSNLNITIVSDIPLFINEFLSHFTKII